MRRYPPALLSALALPAASLAAPPPPAAPVAPAPAVAPADLDTRLAALNGAEFDAKAAPSVAVLLRAQAMLARARFSPGAIDGRPGSNFTHVLVAYQIARGLKQSGVLDAATWASLVQEPASARPAARAYVITAQDLAGPFSPDVGEDLVKLSALPQGPQYVTPLEALAARFHMSRARLSALNPGVDFHKAGARILVIDAAPTPLRKGEVTAIRVSKSKALAAAFGHDGALLAVYPATVGSTERPSPSGEHKVVTVAEPASYVYDPQRLAWGPREHGKFTIKPGPRGPVGTVWIALDAPSYGIHGSPDPEKIGKTASHGCVRLTNWDAESLAAGVKAGALVTFLGARAG